MPNWHKEEIWGTRPFESEELRCARERVEKLNQSSKMPKFKIGNYVTLNGGCPDSVHESPYCLIYHMDELLKVKNPNGTAPDWATVGEAQENKWEVSRDEKKLMYRVIYYAKKTGIRGAIAEAVTLPQVLHHPQDWGKRAEWYSLKVDGSHWIGEEKLELYKGSDDIWEVLPGRLCFKYAEGKVKRVSMAEAIKRK